LGLLALYPIYRSNQIPLVLLSPPLRALRDLTSFYPNSQILNKDSYQRLFSGACMSFSPCAPMTFFLLDGPPSHCGASSSDSSLRTHTGSPRGQEMEKKDITVPSTPPFFPLPLPGKNLGSLLARSRLSCGLGTFPFEPIQTPLLTFSCLFPQ